MDTEECELPLEAEEAFLGHDSCVVQKPHSELIVVFLGIPSQAILPRSILRALKSSFVCRVRVVKLAIGATVPGAATIAVMLG